MLCVDDSFEEFQDKKYGVGDVPRNNAGMSLHILLNFDKRGANPYRF